jgi:hypothetical protein
MPFHVGGHKPKPTPKKSIGFSVGRRILFGGVGAFMICDGLFRFNQGQFFGVDWYSRPVYTTSFVVTGAVGVLFSLLPVSWLERAAKRISR